jgi:Mg2+ and Co2+ transporter CorA
MELLSEKLNNEAEALESQKLLTESEQYQRIAELKKRNAAIEKSLKSLDNDLVTGQIAFNL